MAWCEVRQIARIFSFPPIVPTVVMMFLGNIPAQSTQKSTLGDSKSVVWNVEGTGKGRLGNSIQVAILKPLLIGIWTRKWLGHLQPKPKQEVVSQAQRVHTTGHSSKMKKNVFWKWKIDDFRSGKENGKEKGKIAELTLWELLSNTLGRKRRKEERDGEEGDSWRIQERSNKKEKCKWKYSMSRK